MTIVSQHSICTVHCSLPSVIRICAHRGPHGNDGISGERECHRCGPYHYASAQAATACAACPPGTHTPFADGGATSASECQLNNYSYVAQ